jgi:hypothetical protein
MRTLLGTLVILAALVLPASALADKPAVTAMHVDYTQVIPGDQNPCGFDLMFTGLGDLSVTTFSDGTQIAQGILQHTVSGPGATLSSIGPASVHIDPNTGIATDTGMQFSFHVPGEGVVLAQAGNFSFLPDGTVVAIHGLNLFSPALCDVLA